MNSFNFKKRHSSQWRINLSTAENWFTSPSFVEKVKYRAKLERLLIMWFSDVLLSR
jgi:hypothetical protein